MLAFQHAFVKAAISLIAFFPCKNDVDGVGLRVTRLPLEPLVTGERIDRGHSFDVSLLNNSHKPVNYIPLLSAVRPKLLQLDISLPDGKPLERISVRKAKLDPFAVEATLQPGEIATVEMNFKHFLYHEVYLQGKHTIRAMIQVNGRRIESPPVTFSVIKLRDSDILESHTVPLEGPEAARAEVDRVRVVVEQVLIDGRTYLFYRRFLSAGDSKRLPERDGVDCAFRIARLRNKVRMHVEGAYGSRNPITITFDDALSSSGKSSLVINSTDGMPWTEAEEQLRLERLQKPKP